MMSTKAESNRSGKVHRSWGYYKVLHQENDTVKVKSDYFKNLKLKSLDLKVEDLLPKSSLKEYSGESNSISSIMIDSIKIAAREFIPSKVSSNDTIVIETSKGTIKLQYYPDIAYPHILFVKAMRKTPVVHIPSLQLI